MRRLRPDRFLPSAREAFRAGGALHLALLLGCGGGDRQAAPAPTDGATADASIDASVDGESTETSFGGGFPPESNAGEPTCADAGDRFVEVTGDGPAQTFRAGCELATVPFGGHMFLGGEGDSTGVGLIAGCAAERPLDATSPGPSSVSVTSVLSAVGDTDAATIAYDDSQGRAWSGPATLHVTRWSLVGGTIEGNYLGSATQAVDAGNDGGSATLTLGGTFRVCHAFDGQPAP